MHAIRFDRPRLEDALRPHREALVPWYRSVAAALRATSDGGQTGFGIRRSPSSLTVDRSTLHPVLDGILAELLADLSDCDVLDIELWFNEGGVVYPHSDAAFWLQTGRAQGIQLWTLLDAVDWTRTGFVDAADPNGLRVWLPPPPGVVFPLVKGAITAEGVEPVSADHYLIADRPGQVLLFHNGLVHDKPRQQPRVPTLRAALGLRMIRTADRELARDRCLIRWFSARIAEDPDVVAGMRRSPYYRQLLEVLEPGERGPMPTKVDRTDLAALAERLSGACRPS